jgi:predicted nucleotidyltransferase
MAELHDDEGTIIALLDRFRLQRLPAALEIKARVDRGETLSDHDIDVLSQILADSRDTQSLARRHPELESLIGKAIALYKEITDKALANEKAG